MGRQKFTVDLDGDVEITLNFLAADDQLVSTIVLSISIDEDEKEQEPSQFDALVRAHQENSVSISPVRSRDSWLRRMEAELLTVSSSWKPILATPGWAKSSLRLTDSRILGSTQPLVDPRPLVEPPVAFKQAREEVLEWLHSSPAPLPESDLADEKLTRISVDYLRAYREWGEEFPEKACWLDTVSLLELESIQYGGQASASPEPVAVLVSALHPIRFGWHVAAQRILSLGLDTPCPLAGLLDPHRCPDVLSLALARSGGEPRWKSYVAISCQDALWGLFWNADRLRELQQHESNQELVQAGVVPRGIQSGFTASQAGRTLEEITHVLPTRAILRIGIVGSGQGRTSCTEGLFAWSRQPFDRENGGFYGLRTIEVYDSRISESRPTSEEISSLANDTGHHVQWFSPSTAVPDKDLVIVDHLGLANPVKEVHPWRSPASEGSLIRSRIRLDRKNAELVIESRGWQSSQKRRQPSR